MELPAYVIGVPKPEAGIAGQRIVAVDLDKRPQGRFRFVVLGLAQQPEGVGIALLGRTFGQHRGFGRRRLRRRGDRRLCRSGSPPGRWRDGFQVFFGNGPENPRRRRETGTGAGCPRLDRRRARHRRQPGRTGHRGLGRTGRSGPRPFQHAQPVIHVADQLVEASVDLVELVGQLFHLSRGRPQLLVQRGQTDIQARDGGPGVTGAGNGAPRHEGPFSPAGKLSVESPDIAFQALNTVKQGPELAALGEGVGRAQQGRNHRHQEPSKAARGIPGKAKPAFHTCSPELVLRQCVPPAHRRVPPAHRRVPPAAASGSLAPILGKNRAPAHPGEGRNGRRRK